MSATESKSPGTLGHAKGMAGAIYMYESERGNVYPRLDLSIDYRDPKHIRIRAYDEDHHVVDTLGANDIAEACLLVGLTVRYGETMHARKMRGDAPPTPRRRPPVAVRFLDALTLQLRRQKAAGAAESVHRAASLQFHPTNWRAEQEPRQVLALAEFALRHWAIRGLEQLDGEQEHDAASQMVDYLAIQPPFSADDAADAAVMLGQVAESLRDPEEVSGPNPLTKNGTARVLNEVMLALRHAGQVGKADLADASSLPGDPLARSVEHAALALAVAFRVGVITELPPASNAVFAWLDRTG
jgi:hypothetical protein